MQETVQQVIAHVQANPVLFLGIALVAGLAGSETVAYGGKSGVLRYLLVGGFGFFLAQFMIFYFGLQEYIEKLPEFRILFDFIAAYIGSFFVAAIIHFVKPL